MKKHRCWAHIIVIMHMLPSWWFRRRKNYLRVADLQDLIMCQLSEKEINTLKNQLQTEWACEHTPYHVVSILQKLEKQVEFYQKED